MRTGSLVAALTMSGVVGGLAGAILAQGIGGPAAPAPAPRDAGAAREGVPGDDLARDVAGLRARLDEMQASVAAASEEAARLRAEVEKERTAAAETRTRLHSLETAGPRPDESAADGNRIRMLGAEVDALQAKTTAFSERFRKIAELRRMSQEERWAAARDALSLTAGQEEELKAAIKERAQAMADAIRLVAQEAKNLEGGGTDTLAIGTPDIEKLRDARRRYDERVNAALTQDQAKRWREEGYEAAMGGGGADVTRAVIIEGGR